MQVNELLLKLFEYEGFPYKCIITGGNSYRSSDVIIIKNWLTYGIGEVSQQMLTFHYKGSDLHFFDTFLDLQVSTFTDFPNRFNHGDLLREVIRFVAIKEREEKIDQFLS